MFLWRRSTTEQAVLYFFTVKLYKSCITRRVYVLLERRVKRMRLLQPSKVRFFWEKEREKTPRDSRIVRLRYGDRCTVFMLLQHAFQRKKSAMTKCLCGRVRAADREERALKTRLVCFSPYSHIRENANIVSCFWAETQYKLQLARH